ncbi:hypothetical protein [Paenibacillus harenae]|nr:hypothetical protein [Paenibacillus harenae]MDQ0063798.1 hypothetical protein [Paenibacillus harenae]
MKMIGLGILIMVAGFIADTAWHNKHGFPVHHGIPESHYLMFIGATVGAVAAFRLIRKREATLNKRWFYGLFIAAAVCIAGWLLDNLIYHTRDIYDGGFV